MKAEDQAGRAASQRTTYVIEGVKSLRDTESLKASLSEQPGVDSVDVSPEGREVQVRYEPSTTDSARIAEAIEKRGYRVTNKQSWGC